MQRQLVTWAQTIALSLITILVVAAIGSFTIVTFALAVLAATAVFFAGRVIADVAGSRDTSDRPPAWRDAKVIAIGAQVGAVALLATVLGYLWQNFRARTDAIGLELTWDFLDTPAGITIADNPLTPADTVREAILAGLGNTFRIVIIGVPLSLIVGTLIGIARLSTNWLLRKLATGYVEIFRNLPPLVIILFVWQAVFLQFPAPQNGAWKPLGGWFIFSNNRFAFPSVTGLDNFGTFRWILLAGLLVAAAVWVWRTRVFNETGTPHRRAQWSVGTFLAVGLVAFAVLGGPAELSKPMLSENGRVWTDGVRMQMPYAAVMFALVIYTSTHIAEIVRGSIQAVHKGQVEAANALALNGFQRYRFVILPQAFRIAFPPLINQTLNYTKNSSLALAIGFAEVTSVINNLFGQSQPVPQLILILMAAYLVFSLAFSAVGNFINRRLQLVGR